MPNVTKMTQEQAIAELESAGFKVGTINTKYDESVEAGQVISQDPKGGENARKERRSTWSFPREPSK